MGRACNGDFPICSKMAAKAKRPSRGLLACNCGHLLSLDDLYGVLRLSEEEVLSVLVTGSHLWRTCVATSDWDVYVIVKDSRKTSRDADGVKRTKSKQFDASVLSELEFRSLLEGSDLQYVLPLWAPDELCVRKKDFRSCFGLDREVRQPVMQRTSLHITMHLVPVLHHAASGSTAYKYVSCLAC